MNINYRALMLAFSLTAAATPALADVNCNRAASPQMRAYCYNQMAQIYRQQQQQYEAIARQQYQMHQNIGRALRYVPVVGRYAAPAWNAPRYYYDYRYGRP